MKKTVKRIGGAILALLVLLSGWIAFNTCSIWQACLGKPPVRFLENAEVAVGLYPAGHVSAVVFTCDDFCPTTPLEPVERLRERLKKLGVKGTFFVVPYHLGKSKLEAGQPQVEMLKKLRASGHEIAQHGYLHYCRRNEDRGVKMGAEMLFLSFDEQVERLRRGREILAGLGLYPRGHRSPCFSGTEKTLRALDELGFLYGSDLSLPPTTLSTLLKPGFKGSVIYPYHPSGLKLLEVTSQTDPTVRKKKVMKVFHRFHPRGGVLAILTHLPEIGEEENLNRLEEFLLYVKSRDVWLCRLDELCGWWLGRENLCVETEREGDTLVVVYDNPSPYPLEDATVVFKETDLPLGKYRIVDRTGKSIREGTIPPTRRISVNLR